MLTQPLIQQLHELRLRGMAAGLEQQNANAERAALSFEERLGLLISHECWRRYKTDHPYRLKIDQALARVAYYTPVDKYPE